MAARRDVTLSVLIPCYNEAATIDRTLDAVAALGARLRPDGIAVQVVAVDDCSRDGTYERPDQIPPRVASVTQGAQRSLYAVFRPASGGADYRVLFLYRNSQRFGLAIDLTDGGIVEMNTTCGTVEMATKGVTDFIIPPPKVATP